jgi:hypothetical protein
VGSSGNDAVGSIQAAIRVAPIRRLVLSRRGPHSERSQSVAEAAAPPETGSRSDSKSYLDLEVPIRDVTYMAGIVRDLAYELLDVESRKKPDSDVVIRMSQRGHEQLFFAISDVLDRARELEKLYHAQ